MPDAFIVWLQEKIILAGYIAIHGDLGVIQGISDPVEGMASLLSLLRYDDPKEALLRTGRALVVQKCWRR